MRTWVRTANLFFLPVPSEEPGCVGPHTKRKSRRTRASLTNLKRWEGVRCVVSVEAVWNTPACILYNVQGMLCAVYGGSVRVCGGLEIFNNVEVFLKVRDLCVDYLSAGCFDVDTLFGLFEIL